MLSKYPVLAVYNFEYPPILSKDASYWINCFMPFSEMNKTIKHYQISNIYTNMTRILNSLCISDILNSM